MSPWNSGAAARSSERRTGQFNAERLCVRPVYEMPTKEMPSKQIPARSGGTLSVANFSIRSERPGYNAMVASEAFIAFTSA
jgi:hypothetical protein